MKLHFGKYAYYWHLIPAVKLHSQRARWNKNVMYLSLEFGWLKWWGELEIINTFSNDGW